MGYVKYNIWLYIKARNQKQADLYARFVPNYIHVDRKSAAAAEKTAQARQLQSQVAQDAPRSRGTPRSAEERYLLKLRKQGAYLQQVKAIKAPEDDADMKELRQALERMPTFTSGEAKDSAGEAPDYDEALETLDRALAAADRKVAAQGAVTVQQIEQMEQQKNTPERAANAQKLVAETNNAVLSRLPVKEQLRLMSLVRGDLESQPKEEKKHEAFMTAQSKLYHAMELRPELRAHEKQLRRTVMKELEKDKKMLKEARDLWHTYTAGERHAVMMKIVKVHSEALGCEPPHNILFTSDPGMSGYEWRPGQRVIVAGTAHGEHLDFEKMMDGLFHENTHNWQDHLVNGLKKDDAAKNPLHEQALVFQANQPFYIHSTPDWVAYRYQPVEAHAHRSGVKLSSDLMRMLAN